MKHSEKHKLWDEDEKLFSTMRENYVSLNEKNFFSIIRHKQEFEITDLNDLLVSEYENQDEIYVIREYYDEYVVGHGIDSDGEQEVHVMNLSEALSLNLKGLGFIDRDITLHEWLRECDYRCVNYQRNWDNINHTQVRHKNFRN
ncbi:MAG: hypothetical protein J6Y87_03980 [Muribaculaceae bacterium]|nr:hypothetical protein [Muribaculaceae bacterium]